MQIIDLDPGDEERIEQTAQLVFAGFKEGWPSAWPTIEAAREEVRASFGPRCVSRIAVDANGNALGWETATREYNDTTWQLQVLVVSGQHRGEGIGRALVSDAEALARQRGACTLWLGSDDETGQTTLSGVDLYPDVCQHIARIRNLKGHPYEFYQKLGFVIVGVLPDANGPGKPDIFLAKRVGGA
jgi:aminoglycoside 6'-N-acetyltransferase I